MKEAEAMYQRTLDTRQKTFGLTHEQLLKSTYKLMARYVVVSEHEKVYSFDAPSTEELREGPGTLQTVSLLGELMRKQTRGSRCLATRRGRRSRPNAIFVATKPRNMRSSTNADRKAVYSSSFFRASNALKAESVAM
jgi:hypothetical protein